MLASESLKFEFFPLTGKPELPRQPGSTAQYEAEASKSEPSPEGAQVEADSPQSSDTEANFFHTLEWQGKGNPLLVGKCFLLC